MRAIPVDATAAASGVDAALRLRAPGPPPGALVCARCPPVPAGHAADGEEGVLLQGMARQGVARELLLDPDLGPAGERVELDLVAGELDHRQEGADRAVKALAAGDPGIEVPQRPAQGIDLADAAAA